MRPPAERLRWCKVFKTFANAWKIEDIRKKILFTLFVILLYRVGNAVPVPYVNVAYLQQYFTSLENTVLGLYNVMSSSSAQRTASGSRTEN